MCVSRKQPKRPVYLEGIGRPKGLLPEVNRHGNLRWSVQSEDRKRIILRKPDGSPFTGEEDYRLPSFRDAYVAARFRKPDVKPATAATRALTASDPNSVAWLIRQFMQSDHWKSLKPSTIENYRGTLRGFEEKCGHFAFRSITEGEIYDAHARKAKENPVSANKSLGHLTALFRWACENWDADRKEKLLSRNPCLGVAPAREPEPESHKPWSAAEHEAFKRKYPRGTRERFAYAMLFGSGQRRSDVILLGRQHLTKDGAGLKLAGQVKTGKPVFIPIVGNVWFPEFADEIAAAKEAGITGDLTFLVDVRGRPYTNDQFGRWFSRVIRAAGIEGHTAHSLRASASCAAVEAGITGNKALEAIFGDTPDVMKTYLAEHDRERTVLQAIRGAA